MDLQLHAMARVEIEAAVAESAVAIGIVILSNVIQLDHFAHAVLVAYAASSDCPHPPFGADPLPVTARHRHLSVPVVDCRRGEHSVLQYRDKGGLRPNIVMWTGSIAALRGLVGHGFGVTILSNMVYRLWSPEGKRIEARPVLDTVPQMDADMLWKPDRELTGATNAFQQFLIHSFWV